MKIYFIKTSNHAFIGGKNFYKEDKNSSFCGPERVQEEEHNKSHLFDKSLVIAAEKMIYGHRKFRGAPSTCNFIEV